MSPESFANNLLLQGLNRIEAKIDNLVDKTSELENIQGQQKIKIESIENFQKKINQELESTYIEVSQKISKEIELGVTQKMKQIGTIALKVLLGLAGTTAGASALKVLFQYLGK